MASTDKPEDNKKFAADNEVKYQILSDPEKKASAAYGVLSSRGFASRVTIYIDKEGIIKAIDKEVKVQTAGADLAKKLAELKFPKVESK